MAKVLVTGSNGQLGSELRAISKELKGVEFLFTDIDNLDLGDVNAVANYIKSQKPDYIINCAAYTAVDKAEEETVQAEKVNSEAVQNIVSNLKTTKIKLIHVSTDYVFDGKNHRPYVETDKVNPTSIYGKTKLHGEKYALSHSFSMVIRTSWLYSTYGKNFIKTIRKLGKERKELSVIFDQVGSPTNAADLASFILYIIQKDFQTKEFHPGVYHFSNEGVCSWYDFAKEILKQSEIECKVFPIESVDFPTPAPRPHYSVLNKSKIKSTFEIQIPYWKDSLKNCITNL